MRTVLFYRDIRRFTGGHLKMKHYYDHLACSPDYRPVIHFAPTTIWDEANPWHGSAAELLPRWAAEQADLLFLGGVDWLRIKPWRRRRYRIPIINLIQHVNHADPRRTVYRFLKHHAVRICVSPEVEQAIRATGRVNGPIFTIPNCIDLEALPSPLDESERRNHVLIAGSKEPLFAKELGHALEGHGIPVELLVNPLPHPVFLEKLRAARISLLVPNATEGFYLPALEGMALGTLVVCPDCVANRSFCLPGHNCYRPDYTIKGMVEAVVRAWRLAPEVRREMISRAAATAESHPLEKERQAFYEILRRVDRLWSGKD